MLRLFVALGLPESIKQSLIALQTSIPSTRWVQPQTLHLTLRFIGDVEDNRVDTLKTRLSQVKPPAFDMRLHGSGRFPLNPQKAPRVLWIGVDAPPALHTLQQKIEDTLQVMDFPPNNKPFKSHITLARIKAKKPLPEVGHFLDAHADFATERFHVQEFLLLSSMLTPQGSQYTHIVSFPLIGA